MKDRIQELALVESQSEIAKGIYRLRLRSEGLAQRAKPGQFVNILLRDNHSPLLRRPFSISSVDGTSLSFVYNVIGRGTRIMAARRAGEQLDVLGPLGRPFGFEGSFEHAIIVAGGLGVAPFPFLTEVLTRGGKTVATYVGGRTADQIVGDGLQNIRVSTDDGSAGFHGTVVELLARDLEKSVPQRAKIFACGPTPMMKALSDLAAKRSVDCELSLEGDMACGIGLCQGCPVEKREGESRYALVCADGPTFQSSEVVLP
jgi:dihydroorotate dehydrogenase electron transfer subunit